MINFFRPLPVYIRLYHNKVEITDLSNDQTVCQSAIQKFSSERLLVAEFAVAEKLIKDMLKDMGISKKNLKVIIQQIDNFEDELCESEKRILRDIAEQVGAKAVYIVNRKKEMSKEEIDSFLLTT